MRLGELRHRGSWVAVVIALMGCMEAPPGPGVLASHSAGSVTLDEVEDRLRDELANADPDTTADWPARYRETAEVLAIEQWLMRDVDASTASELSSLLQEELATGVAQLLCEAALDVYVPTLPLGDLEPTAEEIRAYFDEHRAAFERPEQRLTWHLFLRRDEGEAAAPLMARLRQLRSRSRDGESFRQLAEEHSESENRSLGGHLGWIVPGELPPALEEVVFALPPGGTSEPLATADGAFLVHVSDVLPGVSPSFEEAHPVIRQRLEKLALLQRLEELASDLDPGEGAVVLGEEELQRQLATAKPDSELLRIGDYVLRPSDLVEKAEAQQLQGFDPVPTEDRLEETYRLEVARALHCREALESDLLENPDRKQRFDVIVRHRGRSALLDQRLREATRERIEPIRHQVRRFHEANRHLFTSPLAMLVEGLAVEPGYDPAATMQRLEEVRDDLVAGHLDLDTAAARLGAELMDRQWVGPQNLRMMEPKVRAYLSQLEGTGYTVPFRQGDKLHLLRVVERREPHPLPFEVAEERVRAQYYQRHQQRLFAQAKAELLEEARYRFHPSALERHLDTLGLGEASRSAED